MIHDFNDQLAYSHSQTDQPWWNEVYRLAFPNFASMVSVRADGWAQRGGIDRVLTLNSGKTLWIDEKVRRKHWDDICLEYWSDRDRRIRGWVAKDLACDYIAYAFETSGVCYLLPFLQLRRAWREHHVKWVRDYPSVPAPNNGYVTVSVAVPTETLLGALTQALIVEWKVAA